jgi:hypothetical protein
LCQPDLCSDIVVCPFPGWPRTWQQPCFQHHPFPPLH